MRRVNNFFFIFSMVLLARLYRLNLNPFPVGFKNVSSRVAVVVFSYQAEVVFIESDSVCSGIFAFSVVVSEYDEVFLDGIVSGHWL